MPWLDPSLPNPDSFTPPKAASAAEIIPLFIPTMPDKKNITSMNLQLYTRTCLQPLPHPPALLDIIAIQVTCQTSPAVIGNIQGLLLCAELSH